MTPHQVRPRAAVWSRRTMQLIATLLVAACDPLPLPTDPGTPAEQPETIVTPTQRGPGQVFSDRARVMDPARFALVSAPGDLAEGRYRYQIGNQAPEAIGRDDILVSSADGKPFVRRVLSSQVVGQELVLETGPALWSDVINSGTYGLTMPLAPGAGPAKTYSGLSLAPVTIGPASVALPAVQTTLPPTDVCKWIVDLLAVLPGDHPPDVCGKERKFEVQLGVGVSVAGTIDSIKILSGNITVTGDMDVDLTVDAGGITGGRAPVFTPCNRAAYLGCIATPTGAALIDWLRKYAPGIPEASLPSVRICVPGLPVRVRAGYWDRSGFLPRWVLPVFEQCRIADFGQLPTIVLPSFQQSNAIVRPHVFGDMTFKVKGDGTLGLKVAIPGLAASAGYAVGNDFTAKASVGVFVGLKVSMKNAGATVKVTFDDTGALTQTWTDGEGWTGDFQVTDSDNNGQILEVDNPDSVAVRMGVSVEAKAELCIAIISCEELKPKKATAVATPQPAPSGLFDIAIGIKAGAEVSLFEEGVWNRQVVNPSDSSVDNWNVDIDGAYELTLEAGIKIPLTGFILPRVPREWSKTWECCRIAVGDLWGRGNLLVSTTTTGANPDPDGYTVTVARYDTLPVVIEDGAQRLGKARDHGSPLDLSIGTTDSIVFSPSKVPCVVYYTDVLFYGNPVWGSAVAGLRAAGVGVPTYAITAFCDLLIARHTVTLTGVSDNCTVTGGPVNDAVWLQQKNKSIGRSDTARVHFDVVCDGNDPLGDLQVQTKAATTPSYTGDYHVAVDGAPWGAIGPFETRTLTGLRAGTRNVVLTGGPGNCIALEPVDVDVPAGGLGTVTLSPICFLPDEFHPGDVTVAATTTGSGTDEDGYQIKLDGVLRAAAMANGSGTVPNVPALIPSVVQVSNVAGNCRATTPNPLVVTLDADATPASVPFGASCTSGVIDTLEGVVESSTWPTLAVSLRLADGTVQDLAGPLRSELVQLTGTTARVWGVTAGSTTDVFGYDLRTSLDDPRWVGIVAVRSGEVWLFGEDGVHLLDVLPGLKANPGALVWVSGVAEGAIVRPTAFGVIREAQP